MSESSKVTLLKERLLMSHWPKCNEIANELYEIGGEEAKLALLQGLKAKRHHIRTASIKTLTKFNDESSIEYIKAMLNDPAYETRMEAKKAIKELTGEDILTGKGE
ncbi:MAG: HEAT repeat domain-containing protein [Clostridiaceae bacterium]|nr:HEAT repeat domain-containing protein [Clostridiaceae bacterium]